MSLQNVFSAKHIQESRCFAHKTNNKKISRLPHVPCKLQKDLERLGFCVLSSFCSTCLFSLYLCLFLRSLLPNTTCVSSRHFEPRNSSWIHSMNWVAAPQSIAWVAGYQPPLCASLSIQYTPFHLRVRLMHVSFATERGFELVFAGFVLRETGLTYDSKLDLHCWLTFLWHNSTLVFTQHRPTKTRPPWLLGCPQSPSHGRSCSGAGSTIVGLEPVAMSVVLHVLQPTNVPSTGFHLPLAGRLPHSLPLHLAEPQLLCGSRNWKVHNTLGSGGPCFGCSALLGLKLFVDLFCLVGLKLFVDLWMLFKAWRGGTGWAGAATIAKLAWARRLPLRPRHILGRGTKYFPLSHSTVPGRCTTESWV